MDQATKDRIRKKKALSLDQSVMGARIFYFALYGLFYLSVCLYNNKLRDAFLMIGDSLITNMIYVLYYFGISGAAIYYFLNAGKNPGFVDETESEDSKKRRELKLKMQASESSEEADETIDIGLSTSQPEIVKEQDLSTTISRESKLKSFLSLRSFSKEQTAGEDDAQETEAVDPESGIEFVPTVNLPAKRFCEACNHEQPYRSRHCWECNRCVRKFDHHCFWIGGCVGELNHGKFFLFLVFQTWQEILAFLIAADGRSQAKIKYSDLEDLEQKQMRNHILAVFLFFEVVLALFFIFTVILGGYHLFLITSGQTTWEHSSRSNISYLRPYSTGVLPFYETIAGNVKQVFCHGGKCREWQLGQPQELKEK